MSAKAYPQLILFGDSQIQTSFSPEASVGSRLADNLARRCDVINRGFTGYNTTLAKLVLPGIFSTKLLENTTGVVILFGSNDAAVDNPGKSNQHISLEAYGANLEDIVDFFIAHGIPKEHIILVAPPPVVADAWDQFCRETGKTLSPRSNTEVEKYANAAYEVAKAKDTLFLDLYESMMNKTEWQSFLADGLHLSSAGSVVFFEKLWPIVQRMLKSYPVRFPDWKEVDFANPGPSF